MEISIHNFQTHLAEVGYADRGLIFSILYYITLKDPISSEVPFIVGHVHVESKEEFLSILERKLVYAIESKWNKKGELKSKTVSTWVKEWPSISRFMVIGLTSKEELIYVIDGDCNGVNPLKGRLSIWNQVRGVWLRGKVEKQVILKS